MVQETKEDKGFLQSTADFFKNLDYGQLAEESIPFVGENIIIGNIKENLKEGSLGSAALNTAALGIGVIPGAGDLLAMPFRALAKKYSKAQNALKKAIKNTPTDTRLAEPVTSFFKTGKGSEYVMNKGNITTRHKKVTGENLNPSAKTIFLDQKAATIFKDDFASPNQLQKQVGGEGYRTIIPDPTSPNTTANIILETSKGPVKKATFNFSLVPKKGLQPLEILENGTHIGNPITQVDNVAVDDIAKYTATKTNMVPVRPINQSQLQSNKLPFKKGGEFVNPINKEILTNKNAGAINIKIEPTDVKGGKPMATMSAGNFDVEKVGTIGKGNTQIKVNLIKPTSTGKKGGWEWVSKNSETKDANTLISVTKGNKHYYTYETDFSKGGNLTTYPASASEPRLRPTTTGQLEFGEEIGTIRMGKYDKNHPKAGQPRIHSVYSKITTFSEGGLVSNNKYNEGGPVMALEEQTEMAFGDEPPRIDPVSGNEVPPGALPSEVRDDIPARLSEGEYVVPADVLQYYGIKFFEDLRGKAKMELASMEENGRMGGEPVDDASMDGMDDLPFSAEELNTYDDGQDEPVREFQEGGLVTEMASLQPQTFVKTYVNSEGSKLYIRFVNGVAIPPVPPGYFEEGAPVEGVAPVAPVDSTMPENEPQDSEADQSIWDGTKPPVRMSIGELAMAMAIHSGGTKIPLDSLPTVGLIKGVVNLMGGNTSMSELLQKEAKKRLEDTEGLTGNEVLVLTNMSNLPLDKIATWRNTLSKPVSKGGAATSLNKFSDIFKGRNDPTRTGTGIQTYKEGLETTTLREETEAKKELAKTKQQKNVDAITAKAKEEGTNILGTIDREAEAKTRQERDEQNRQEDAARSATTTVDKKEIGTSSFQSGSAYSGRTGSDREFGMNKGGLATRKKKKKQRHTYHSIIIIRLLSKYADPNIKE